MILVLLIRLCIAPFAAVKVTGTRYVDRGSAITLLCDAAGDPEPPADVTWYHDGQRLTSGHRVTISKRVESRAVLSQLLVRRARLADSGVYVCRSTNRDAGEASVYVLNGEDDVTNGGGHFVSPLLLLLLLLLLWLLSTPFRDALRRVANRLLNAW